jgi:hypothetical protein
MFDGEGRLELDLSKYERIVGPGSTSSRNPTTSMFRSIPKEKDGE